MKIPTYFTIPVFYEMRWRLREIGQNSTLRFMFFFSSTFGCFPLSKLRLQSDVTVNLPLTFLPIETPLSCRSIVSLSCHLMGGILGEMDFPILL